MMKPLFYLAIVFLIGCNNQPGIPTMDIIQPDTGPPIIITPVKSNTYPSIFEEAFQYRTIVKQDGIQFSFYSYNLGKIKIESGKILASDPITMHDATAFKYNFPVGEFPVNLAMVEFRGDERVAFSRIYFTSDTVAKWELALKPGQDSLPVGDSNIYCYGVDAGMGLFADSIANKMMNNKRQMEWDKAFISKASEKEYKGYIYEFDQHNLATFNTGFGDGCYASYIGYNSKGEICQLLTDFGIIHWLFLPGSSRK